jgi:hypothetical protein
MTLLHAWRAAHGPALALLLGVDTVSAFCAAALPSQRRSRPVQPLLVRLLLVPLVESASFLC